ncbi:NAD(P)H-binding protein [Amycolatopsis acidiphila]|uniref:Sugar nucleotide-binding protein n=1 Tax=Amycolatopsis acidiphila TaxID=715473 RepID=A0A558AHH7_9PSEU|nr:NAD(P)H-binding protein [Amycolatopsis acidiphila]TVT23689.1 sugar nucleotide-binding protein [Amycolatopsis acidiphila]UIJ58681.1 NAD(P)H-binding protein [Amycolatopsis acidiphila]GHG76057.1 nucleoside-diphosphate sugar epimerase [Amycolatopsis acidiphila]
MSSFVVVGGTGRTGSRIAERLTAAGHDVVVSSREPAGAEAVRLDLAAPDPAVFAGADGIVISVEPPKDAADAEAVMHHGVAAIAAVAAREDVPVVLVSQIYVTRAAEHPEMAARIEARARGEQTLRDSGAQYTIVRPSWLHDLATGGVRIEQGDTGEGRISRDAVAAAAVAALFDPSASGKTFELYDDQESPEPDWSTVFAALSPDPESADL